MNKYSKIVLMCFSVCCFMFLNYTIIHAETEGHYQYEVVDNQATIIEADYYLSGEVTIPSHLGGYPVTNIDNLAFYGHDDITKVIIPDSVTRIGSHAFRACNNLESVELGAGVETIEMLAFSDTGLKSITIPDQVKSIGDSAFNHCTSLTEITLGTGVQDIGPSAFQYCWRVEKVYWNAIDVNDMEEGAFRQIGNESNGTEIVFGDKVERIPAYAFYVSVSDAEDKNNITSVIMGKSIEAIGESSFAGCDKLSSICIPDSVTVLGKEAFSHCTALKQLTVGTGVTNVGAGAFTLCTALEQINWNAVSAADLQNRTFHSAGKNSTGIDLTFGDAVKKIPANFLVFCEANVNTITLGNNVQEIGDAAFNGCGKVTELYLPDSVTDIGASAFSSMTALEKINIPSSVTEIKRSTFHSCAGLKHVYIPETVVNFGDFVFYACDNLERVNIPIGVQNIGDSSFYDCFNLKYVYYSGTEQQWEDVSIMGFNDGLKTAEIIYNYDGHPIQFYHFVAKYDPLTEEIVALANFEYITQDGYLVVAMYTGENTLVDVQIINITNKENRIVFSDGSDYEDYYLRAFCWDANHDMTPASSRTWTGISL